jgi:pimeloyl-ACP methyl ester carboxylesterase
MKQPMRDVIVLLPGIMGSVLEKDGRAVWGFTPGAIARALFSRGDAIAEALMLEEDDDERETLGDGVTVGGLLPDLHLLPGFWKIDGYTTIWKALERTFDVREGENLFAFPYDWRRDNRASARSLERKVGGWLANVRRQNPDAKLILIAHSMGGIVARYFLEVLGGWRDTRALVTLGTPYRGSLNALDTLSNGIRKASFTLNGITAFARTCTSIHQLLPIYPALTTGDGSSVRVGEFDGVPRLEAKRAGAALAVHREIMAAVDANRADPLYVADRYALFPIVGINQSTRQSARLEADRVVLADSFDGDDLSGDGTVPRVSALPHEYGDGGNAAYFSTKHGALQNTSAVLNHVQGVLSSLYIDLGKFLEPDRRIQLSLDMEDVYFDDEPVVVRVGAGDADRLELCGRLVDAVSGAELSRLPLRNLRDGTYVVEFAPLPEGSYRVEIGGDPSVAPVADSAGVTGRTS